VPIVDQETFGAVTLLVHLTAATGVTLHVLLNKRDVGATVSWIGLAWLSPVVGSALYWLIGINRVRRRALRLVRPSIRTEVAAPGAPLPDQLRHLATLEIAGWRITRRRAEPGNRIDILRDGDGAYPRMIAAIAAAERSVGLSTYIFRDDVAGEAFVSALADAQRRGVEVRVLIDGFGGGYLGSPAYRRLRALGVPAARFLHSEKPWRMPFLNMRTHKKILVADGRIAFAGGLNIGAENLLAGRPRHPVRDSHFELGGPIVGQLVEAFCEDWLFTTGETWRARPGIPNRPQRATPSPGSSHRDPTRISRSSSSSCSARSPARAVRSVSRHPISCPTNACSAPWRWPRFAASRSTSRCRARATIDCSTGRRGRRCGRCSKPAAASGINRRRSTIRS